MTRAALLRFVLVIAAGVVLGLLLSLAVGRITVMNVAIGVVGALFLWFGRRLVG